MDLWIVVKTLIKAELSRLWRKVLRRPEPPTPYTHFRTRRDQTTPSPGDVDPL